MKLFSLFCAALLFCCAAGAQEEKPISPETIQSPDALNKDTQQLIISGFGVGAYNYLFNNNENTFSSSALALSLFKPVTDRLSVFGQLNVALEGGTPFIGEEDKEGTETSAEIDNLQLRWVPSTKGPEIVFGKFDSPMGIERDDAPLNYQATESFNFTFGRPVKFTGVQMHQSFSEHYELWAILANGWDQDPDNNKSKTFGAYGMWIPTPKVHVGIGEIIGGEGDSSVGVRKTTVATFLYQPAANFVVGAEGNYGIEPLVESDVSGEWYGGLVFGHYRFANRWGVTIRYEAFRDRDGFRTGTAQTLSSFTVSPQYNFSRGFYGIFRYLERTTLSLPEVALRVDLRMDHSNQRVFVSDTEEGKKNNPSVTVQTVFLF